MASARKFASLLGLFLLCQSCVWNQDHPPASAQIAGRFYLEKNTYALGEPVFLYFEASNPGTKAHDIIRADPYSFCAGYEIRLSSDPSPTSRCAIRQPGGSCASSSRTLPPGGSYTESILLNYDHKIDEPGYYVVDAARSMPHGVDPSQMMGPNGTTLKVRERLRFLVKPAKFTSEELAEWLEKLHSGDNESRREAARTLASLAPRSLENTLIGLADSDQFKGWVPLAMHRLNTPRSIAVLAKIVGSQPAADYYLWHVEAANYLGSSGDPQWFPVLLATAQEHPDASYLYPAAESGGDRAVPFLIGLVHSRTGLRRQLAIAALGYTGSRSAVPFLLDLLNNSDSDTSERALYGLSELTHRTLPGTSSSPQAQYPKWLAWWTRHGDSAPIYKPTDCDDVIPLDQD